MTKVTSLPQDILDILTLLNRNGYEAYVIGGAVRDLLLKRGPHDFDLTTNATPDQIQEVFKDYHTLMTNAFFGTVIVLTEDKQVEITTYRKEGNRKENPDDKDPFGKTLKQDCSHRDFTINQLAMDKDGNILDSFDGLKDLEHHVVKAIGDPTLRFKEDPLRMLRYYKFIAELSFEGDKQTEEAIKENRELIKNIAVERIRDTFKVILTYKPTLIDEMDKVGLLEEILPDIASLKNVEQNNPWHYANVYIHTLDALRYVEKQTDLNKEDRLLLSTAVLFHDVGKRDAKTTDEKGIDHFYNHGVLSTKISEKIFDYYRYSHDEKQRLLRLIRYHDLTLTPTRRCFLKLIGKYGFDKHDFMLLAYVMRADESAHVGYSERKKEKEETFEALLSLYDTYEQEQHTFKPSDVALDGTEIMNLLALEPSKEVGTIKNKLFEAIVLGEVSNDKEALKAYLLSHYK